MSYAKVLGATKRQDGYLEGNGYLVSWCILIFKNSHASEIFDKIL